MYYIFVLSLYIKQNPSSIVAYCRTTMKKIVKTTGEIFIMMARTRKRRKSKSIPKRQLNIK